jgi:membrane fusion protein, heavy metal efflux system
MEAHEHDPAAPQQHPPQYDHTATPRGSAFLWGGIGAGVLLVLLLLTHGFGLFGGRGGNGEEAPLLVHQGQRIFIPENSPLRQRLKLMAAAAVPTSGLITAPGIVESDPVRTVVVLPPGAGRVREVKVTLADRVERGQVLAVIDSPDLAQAYDDNDKAASAATLAAQLLKYQEEQFKIGAAAQRDLDQARDANTEAVAEYERTRAHLRAMGAAEGASGDARLLTVRAPVAGGITALSIAQGAVINDDTQPIMTVADLSAVWVTALVAEKDVARVTRNQEAEARVDAYPGKVLRGKVMSVSDLIEPDSRRDKTRIIFDNPDYLLKPNMFATVTLKGAPASHVVVPASALLMNNDRTTVFVATAPWTFERRSVEPLLGESPSVTIASGVKPGEQVVVEGGILIND